MKLFLKCVDKMKYPEIIPDFLSMYGVFTSQNTSHVRHEMSSRDKSEHEVNSDKIL